MTSLPRSHPSQMPIMQQAGEADQSGTPVFIFLTFLGLKFHHRGLYRRPGEHYLSISIWKLVKNKTCGAQNCLARWRGYECGHRV